MECEAMKLNRNYASPADMPATTPLFPLEGALLLPRRPLQLTVFEPRYLAMLDDALSGERLIGVIQPTAPEMTAGPPPDLYPIGCAGRIVQYAEVGDGRCFVTLMGVARFRIADEMHYATPYRVAAADYAPRTSPRARARRRSTATRCSRRSGASPRSTTSRSPGATSRRRRTRRWSTACR
jgi:Lon protease-like protein